jgi:hypothetical protein
MMKQRLEAVQLMSGDFSFQEFETDEKNIENTTKWILDGAVRVWLRNGISVFRIAEGPVPVRYFAVDYNQKPWRCVYCVKVDYSAYIKPLRAACQAGVWKDVNEDLRTKGLATDIFWKILFKNHDMIADTIQTRFGYQFWLSRIQEAYRYNYHIYSMRIKDGKIKEAQEIKTSQQFIERRSSIWGPKATDRFKRIVITLNKIDFESYQKPYGVESNMKLPQAFIEAGNKQKTKLAARIDMSAEVIDNGLCPECRTPMITSHANGIPVLICEKDRIALPIKDE